MYLKFFGLNEKPFAITPDPRYLYLSERHLQVTPGSDGSVPAASSGAAGIARA